MNFLIVFLLWSQANAADYRANHCELFVDRVEAQDGSYQTKNVILGLKILPGRLDAALKHVSRYYRIVPTPSALEFCAHVSPFMSTDCAELGVWKSEALSGRDGRMEAVFTILHRYTFSHQYEVAFYVESEKGTRLWFNPSSGGNFYIDERLFSDVKSHGTGHVQTQDGRFPYLNPKSCY